MADVWVSICLLFLSVVRGLGMRLKLFARLGSSDTSPMNSNLLSLKARDEAIIC